MTTSQFGRRRAISLTSGLSKKHLAHAHGVKPEARPVADPQGASPQNFSHQPSRYFPERTMR